MLMYRRNITILKFSCVLLAAGLTVALFSWKGKQNFVLNELDEAMPMATVLEASTPQKTLPGVGEEKTFAAVTTMAEPLFVGQDAKGNRWRVEAKQAQQAGQYEEQFVWLDDVHATLELGSEKTMTFMAKKGEFDASAYQLKLAEKVEITGQGFVFTTEEVLSNLKTQHTWGQVPVEIRNEFLTLSAHQFDMQNGGEKIIFKGGVRAVFSPEPRPMK